MMPEAARERTVSFRARAPHSLRVREYPRPKASLDERDSCRVTDRGTNVKDYPHIGDNPKGLVDGGNHLESRLD
jgi:hypothetical protein